MASPNMCCQVPSDNENLSANRALMSSAAIVKSLDMISKDASARKCEATFFATEGTDF